MGTRTIRVTSLVLGPITLEAGVVSAVDAMDPGLVSICTHPGEKDAGVPTRIQRVDSCPTCGNTEKTTFSKGRVVGDGVQLVKAEDLQAVKDSDEDAKKTIELTVHKAGDLAAAFPSGKSYYLAPRGVAGANNYALLAALMAKRPDLAFVGEFSFGGGAGLYQLVADNGVIIMRGLARPEAIKERPKLEGVVNEQFLPLAEQFADAICAAYDPEAYRDRRVEALGKLIEAAATVAITGGTATPTQSPAHVDLGDALKAAMAAAGAPVVEEKKTTRRRTKAA